MYRVEDYPQIRGHYLLSGRGLGACRALRGRIALMSVFLHRTPTDWPENRKKAHFTTCASTCSFFESEAARYGAHLSMSRYHFDVTVAQDANPREGFQLVSSFFGAGTVREAAARYAKKLGVDDCVFVLLLDGHGRSFGFRQQAPRQEMDEVSVIFCEQGEKPTRRVFVLAHEMLHQYGAVDYYYPTEVRLAAERYLGNSVMGIGDAVIDDLTAYLVGWKDTVSADTYWFLSDTASIRPEQYRAALDQEWKRRW